LRFTHCDSHLVRTIYQITKGVLWSDGETVRLRPKSEIGCRWDQRETDTQISALSTAVDGPHQASALLGSHIIFRIRHLDTVCGIISYIPKILETCKVRPSYHVLDR
jgi:hypothetical protein